MNFLKIYKRQINAAKRIQMEASAMGTVNLFKKKFCLALAVLFFLLMGALFTRVDAGVKSVKTPPIKGENSFYRGNRPPLLPNALIKLPIGAVKPEGWIRHQLELMANGFTGHLSEISRYCKIDSNAWVSPDGRGKDGWEEVPYWLRGYIELGYILKNKRIIDESKQWVKGVLSSQAPNGYFGPRANWEKAQVSFTTRHDIWPNMVMLYVLRSYYDATHDPRVIKLMANYFNWMRTIPLQNFLPGTWQKWRGGDNLNSIYWLYNHTGQKWLLELALVNHDHTADWAGNIPTWHGVNLAEGFREPAQFYQQIHDPRYLKASDWDYHAFMDVYGQVPGGMFGADENARKGHIGPRQAAETCSMVEFMHSDELMLGISGNSIWAERCEDVAFNSLPAAMTPDLKGLHYLTAPNMVQLDRKSKAPILENGGDMLSYNPWKYRCCQHNVSFGWPYYAERLWMATRDNGLAAVFYAPNTVSAKVASGEKIVLREETNYPFDETVHFSLSIEKSARFPLYFRIPGWTSSARLKINGRLVSDNIQPSNWLVIERTWRNGDRIELVFPMRVTVKIWKKNKNSISVNRGPLTYSLKIGERWVRYGGTDKWPAYEVFPTTPWNYGLIVNVKEPEKSFKVIKNSGKLAYQPFSLKNAPIKILAKAKRIPGWGLEKNGLIQAVPGSPVHVNGGTETVTLIPMGCARLRVSAFPQIGENKK